MEDIDSAISMKSLFRQKNFFEMEFHPPQLVTVHSLLSRPDLNGTIGNAMEWISHKKRYVVHIDDLSAPVLIKPVNLRVILDPDTVRRYAHVNYRPDDDERPPQFREGLTAVPITSQQQLMKVSFFNFIMRNQISEVSSMLHDSKETTDYLCSTTSDIQDGTEAPALVIAAKYARSVEMLRLLLDAGSDIEATDICGGTALMAAAFEGDAPCVKFLLDYGAKCDTRMTLPGMERHLTPFMCALHSGNQEVVTLLKPTSIDIDGVSATLREARDLHTWKPY
jgi:hypothetical protein